MSDAAQLLIGAQQAEAAAHAAVQRMNDRVAHAVRDGAEQVEFCCQTSDDRDPVYLVYFVGAEQLDVLAVQLVEIDGRAPTLGERSELEAEFEAELAGCGDIYEQLASVAWDRF